LGWIDHDERERERMKRILALFSERETRDELGLGAIRDSIADHLFPGTSTIQTRLRYMLFVPWIYRRLEEAGVPSSEIVGRARRDEIRLTDALLAGGEREGVFGKRARGDLQRLPSSVYWAGLGQWGIRRFGASQDTYHQALDSIYAARQAKRQREDESWEADRSATWDPRIPPAPEGFLEQACCKLTRDEADYLIDRVAVSHSRSLLAFLMREQAYADVDFVWEHPRYADFPQSSRQLLFHARLFSEVMFGAAILYNLMLAELVKKEELEEEYRVALADWAAHIDHSRLAHWNLDELWACAAHPAHQVTGLTRQFVREWLGLAATEATQLATNQRARSLIEDRERRLKRSQSRFDNLSARTRWGGASGYAPLSFRWPNVRTFLRDLRNAG
jgi:hypothetical protein